MASKRTYPVRQICDEEIRDGGRYFVIEWDTEEASRTSEPMSCLHGCMEYLLRFVKRKTASLCCRGCERRLVSIFEEEQS